MSSDKSGSPPCGIYIRIDDFSDMPAVITAIRQVAMVINRTSGYEKNMCVVEFVCESGNAQTIERITDLTAIAKAQGFIAILSGDGQLNETALDVDGILLSNLDEVIEARKALGEDAIIGLKCAKSKDMAQKAILLEADYIEMAADPALIGWFKGLGSSLLVNANGREINAENCNALAHAGADLVNVSAYILGHKKGAMQAAVNIQHALEIVVQTPDKLN